MEVLTRPDPIIFLFTLEDFPRKDFGILLGGCLILFILFESLFLLNYQFNLHKEK